jgi:CO/xanthine dehydrogenase Mo-binding subunit
MIKNILKSRREFFRDSQLAFSAVGGLLISCKLKVSKLSEFGRGKESTLNAWIHISSDDTIVFILDRSEMGQGVATTHAMIVAEELNTNPDLIVVHDAPADPMTYYHRDFFVQFTGGSTSTASSWDPLRQAGAEARKRLEMAAAMSWGVPIEECHAEDRFIHHRPIHGNQSKGKLSFGSLAARAAALLPLPLPKPKDPASYRFLGRSQKRRGIADIVTGKLTYGIDQVVPGMLYGSVIRSPYRTGGPGKLPADIPSHAGVLGIFEVSTGIAVVANSTWAAMDLAKKLGPLMDWKQPGELADTEYLRNFYKEALKRSGKPVSRGFTDLFRPADDEPGDINVTYETGYMPHSQMEPLSCTAHFRGSTCEVWVATQFPPGAKQTAAIAAGLSYDSITVHSTAMGGSFGRRFSHEHVREAVEISKKMKRPVKVTWTREDEFEQDYYRPMSVSAMAGSVKGNEIVKWRHRIATQSLIKSWIHDPNESPGLTPDPLFHIDQGKIFLAKIQKFSKVNPIPDPFSVEGAIDVAYGDGVPTIECHEKISPVPIGPVRSIGRCANVFSVESFVDELAHHAKVDPYEFRMMNLPMKSGERKILDFTHQLAGPVPATNSRIFRGYAQARFVAPLLPESRATFCAIIVELSVEDRKILLHRIVAGVDCGLALNPDLVHAQIEGGIIFALSAALKQQIEFKRGIIQQRNFNSCDILRMYETPKIDIHIYPSHERPAGVGEVIIPVVAPAVCNAIFQATGFRIRKLPIPKDLKGS